jgi:hypothetical protein
MNVRVEFGSLKFLILIHFVSKIINISITNLKIVAKKQFSKEDIRVAIESL